MNFLEKFQQLLGRLRSASSSKRPPFEKHYVALLAVYLGYIISDLSLLSIRPMMLPTKAPPVQQLKMVSAPTTTLADYDSILRRNLFNEDGVIPPALGSTGGEESGDPLSRPAVPSQLPIKLLGTIVHANPKLSIATVDLSGKNMSMSYRVDEEIEGLAKVTKVERKKLTFINLNNRRLEFIDIPDDTALSFGLQTRSEPRSNGVVEVHGQFDFSLKRTDIERLTKDLPSLLQQARMEPVFSPDGIGIEGFRFVDIQPGSIYEQLGFKPGDEIRSVNNEAVNSPTKAMEMYNLLKSSNFVQVGVARDGREERFNYTVK